MIFPGAEIDMAGIIFSLLVMESAVFGKIVTQVPDLRVA
jgi:hypothetical protein